MSIPEVKESELYRLLKHGDSAVFNQKVQAGDTVDLRDADLRGLDLRQFVLQGLDLKGVYLRQADLRGLDLSRTNLEGASIKGARISGTYFPAELDADEINLSLLHGTRMRYRCG